jgi:hypothetical protein
MIVNGVTPSPLVIGGNYQQEIFEDEDLICQVWVVNGVFGFNWGLIWILVVR